MSWKMRKVLYAVQDMAYAASAAGGVGMLIWLAATMLPFVYCRIFRAETIDGFSLFLERSVAVVMASNGSECVAVMPGEIDALPATVGHAAGEQGRLIRKWTIYDSMRIGPDGMTWHYASVDRRCETVKTLLRVALN